MCIFCSPEFFAAFLNQQLDAFIGIWVISHLAIQFCFEFRRILTRLGLTFNISIIKRKSSMADSFSSFTYDKLAVKL
jgi:hypothetical protein